MNKPGGERRLGRQKRPRVPESERKRALRACMPCRQHKEKCQGGMPCLRCRQHNRSCLFETVGSQSSPPRGTSPTSIFGPLAKPAHREEQMKRIIRHFLGDISFATSNLETIANSLERESGDTGRRTERRTPTLNEAEGHRTPDSYSIHPLSTSTMHYSGEFSHWNFSKMLRRRLQSLGNMPEENNGLESSNGFYRATALQSPSSVVYSSMKYFPPRDIADFLVDTFLKFAQTNYYYFHETTFRQKMDYYYDNEQPLTINDAGWICTLLMTFAIGTQFAYMQVKTSPGVPDSLDVMPDDHIGLELYRFSCRLIPDLITIASVETVQAFLLLGVYALPIDTSGLAYTYYGLAIKMAVQNGMHRKFPGNELSPATVELRNRLWWTAYSLENRISILHGRPTSMARVDTDCDMPTEQLALQLPGRISVLPNVTATIRLTNELVALAPVIKSLRKAPKVRHREYLQQLMGIRSRLAEWWRSLPTETHCRDLNPQGPLFRCNVHLELSYATTTIYMGRLFILRGTKSGPLLGIDVADEGQIHEIMSTLSSDSLESALRIIELCQLLQGCGGLARVSYTEFSSCRAALLALIAHSVSTPTNRIRKTLAQGMSLIRQTCIGLASAQSDIAVIEALERATKVLDSRSDSEERICSTNSSAYDQFKHWAKLWTGDLSNSTGTSARELSFGLQDQELIEGPSFDGFFSSFPQELNGFTGLLASENELSPDGYWPNDLDTHLQVPELNDQGWVAD